MSKDRDDLAYSLREYVIRRSEKISQEVFARESNDDFFHYGHLKELDQKFKDLEDFLELLQRLNVISSIEGYLPSNRELQAEFSRLKQRQKEHNLRIEGMEYLENLPTQPAFMNDMIVNSSSDIEEEKPYQIRLLGFYPQNKRIAIIKIIREFSKLSLLDSKKVAENFPMLLPSIYPAESDVINRVHALFADFPDINIEKVEYLI